jgi:hypothetical protein
VLSVYTVTQSIRATAEVNSSRRPDDSDGKNNEELLLEVYAMQVIGADLGGRAI